MNGKKAKQLRKQVGYTGESWMEDQTFHYTFSHMENKEKKFMEITNPIKLKIGSKTMYKDKKNAYKTNI